jgi:nucleoside-diphosphate-sugar epimerase
MLIGSDRAPTGEVCQAVRRRFLMRVLIIGGAGYVGQLVLPGLAAAHDVRVLDPRRPETSCDYRPGDATDPATLADACAGMDAVVHMAMAPVAPDGRAEPASAVDVHVKSAYLAVTAAAAAGAGHVVFVSSMSVFADLGFRTLAADETPDATDAYGLTKRLGELACRAEAERTGVALTVLRLCWPTPDEVWPAWNRGLWRDEPHVVMRDGARGLRHPAATPDDPRPLLQMGDGRPLAALAGSDLTAALLAALAHPDGIRALPLTGDTTNACVDLTATRAALGGWWPARSL